MEARAVARAGARRWLLVPLLGALVALATPAARGQLPGLPGAPQPAAGATAATPPAESEEQLRARLLAQLEQARLQRERLGVDPAIVGAPPGVPGEELTRARSSLNQLVVSLENQLRSLGELQSVRAERRDVEKANRDWKGLGSPPPYSLLLVDDLNEAVDSIRTTINALAAQRVIAEREGERAREQAQRNDAELRRAREAVSEAKDVERPKRQWQAQLAQWAAESAAARATLYQHGIELTDEQAALENERLKFAERKLQVASSDFRFSEDDLATIRSREEQRSERIRSARLKAGDRAATLDRELAAAMAELTDLSISPIFHGEESTIPRRSFSSTRN